MASTSWLGLLDQAVGPAVLVLGALLAVRSLVPLLVAAARLLPEAAGRAALRTARWLRPGLTRRLLSLVVGLAAPVAAGAVPTAAASPVEAGAHPASRGLPATEVVRPAARHLMPAGPHARSQGIAPVVVVRPGDTLWAIARRHLHRGATSAEVARAWPRWYAANRDVIGPDPNLILPGARLRVPRASLAREASPRPAGTPAQHHRPASQHVDASSLDPDRR